MNPTRTILAHASLNSSLKGAFRHSKFWLYGLALLITSSQIGCIGSSATSAEQGPVDTTGRATPPALDGSDDDADRRSNDSDFTDDDAYDDERNIGIFASQPEKLVLEFEVFRITAGPGSFDETSRIWEIASGVLPNVNRNLRLKANGFLVAIGRKSDRELLVEYIEQIDDREVISDRVVPDAARLLDIELARRKGTFSLFQYDASGTLRGVEFKSPLPRLRLRTQFRSSNLRKTWLELLPQLEEPDGPSTWVVEEGQTPVLKPEKRRHNFDGLAFGVEIPNGGFLMVGPTSAVQDRPLLARAFFLEGDGKAGEGPQRENVFIIRPIVRAVPIGGPTKQPRRDVDDRADEDDEAIDAEYEEDDVGEDDALEEDEDDGFDPAGAFRPREREPEVPAEDDRLDLPPADEQEGFDPSA